MRIYGPNRHNEIYSFFQMLAGVFERCMKRRGVKETDPYDWEKLTPDNNSSTNLATNPAPTATTKPTG